MKTHRKAKQRVPSTPSKKRRARRSMKVVKKRAAAKKATKPDRQSASSVDPRIISCVDDVPWPAEHRRRLSALIKSPGNMLVVGPPGTGKTSAIEYVIKAIDADPYWIDANESSGILDLKDIKRAVGTDTLTGQRKIIVIDEADSCSPAALNSFRGKMMSYGTPFFLIANDIKRFSAAIQSRCETFLLDDSVREELIKEQVHRASAIAKAEGVSIPAEAVRRLLYPHLPDFRRGMRALDIAIRDVRAGSKIDFSGSPDLVAADTPGTGPVGTLSKRNLQRETAAILGELIKIFERHLAVSKAQALILALFVMHAYAQGAAYFSPILAVLSPEPECGKTSCLNLLRMLIEGATMTIDCTPAGLWEKTEQRLPMILDEADTYLKPGSDLIQILNGGVDRGSAKVTRAGKSYDLWSPKMIGHIGLIAKPSLDSRCIAILMKRKLPSEHRERVTSALEPQFATLRTRCAAWAASAEQPLKRADPKMPEAFNRMADRWHCLLAIAELAGKAWVTLARDAAQELEASRYVEKPIGQALIEDIQDILDRGTGNVIFSADLANSLIALPDKHWGRRLAPYPQIKLAHLLAGYGIQPKNVRDNGRQAKGYHRHQFDGLYAKATG